MASVVKTRSLVVYFVKSCPRVMTIFQLHSIYGIEIMNTFYSIIFSVDMHNCVPQICRVAFKMQD